MNNNPFVKHFDKILAAIFECLPCCPYSGKILNLTIEWFFIIDDLILCQGKRSMDIFYYHGLFLILL